MGFCSAVRVKYVQLLARRLRPYALCKPNRAEPIRLGTENYVMKWKHSHCTPNRAEANRIGLSLTERVHWLMFVSHKALIKYMPVELFF